MHLLELGLKRQNEILLVEFIALGLARSGLTGEASGNFLALELLQVLLGKQAQADDVVLRIHVLYPLVHLLIL